MANATFSEDELLNYARGLATPDLSARIEAAMMEDRAFGAEIAVMRGLGPALKEAETGPAQTDLGWRRLEAAIRREGAGAPSSASRRPAMLWRAAAIVLGMVALGQAAYLAREATVGAPAYDTATSVAEDHVLGIAFADQANAAEIAALLRAADGRLIDGPSALGLYRVAFPSAEALEAAESQFRASPLIALVAGE
ncbi:MAG: hypothetical protein AAGE18_09295 [Pseudomonadota bacterium]